MKRWATTAGHGGEHEVPSNGLRFASVNVPIVKSSGAISPGGAGHRGWPGSEPPSGDVRLDCDRHEVFVRNQAIAGSCFYVGTRKTLDVHIERLRSKVELEPGAPATIVTIRGLGYKSEPPAPA